MQEASEATMIFYDAMFMLDTGNIPQGLCSCITKAGVANTNALCKMKAQIGLVLIYLPSTY